MKRGSILFLRAVIVLVGIGLLAALIWEPQVEGRNADADLAAIYFGDPFLAYVYLGSLPFFFGLHQAFRLLGWMGRGEAGSPEAVAAARRVKFSAVAVLCFIVGAEAYIFLGSSEGEDRAGGVAMGVFLGFPCLVVATAAAVLERVLQKAVELQSENDLTV